MFECSFLAVLLSRNRSVLTFNCAGGAAGSVALVSGSIGNALAVLSFDQDYQKVSLPD